MAAPSLVVVGLLTVAGASTALLTALGWRNRDVVGADWFVAMMSLSTVWIGLSLVALLVQSDVLARFEILASLILTISIPPLWFCFVLEYTGHGHRLDWRTLLLLWAVPAAAIASILTFPWNTLYITPGHPIRTGAFDDPTHEIGLVAWANLAYFGVVVFVGFGLLVRTFWDHQRLFSGQATGLLVGPLVPVAVTALTVVGVLPENVPIIAMGMSWLGLAYAYTLFNHRLLDLVPAARRIGVRDAFDNLGEGVVVADSDGDVVAMNERAGQLFGCDADAVLGFPLERVSPDLAAVDHREGRADVQANGRILDVSVSVVRDARDRFTGRAFVVRDVTDASHRKQRLDVLSRVFRHNIRNTMNAVVGPADVLSDRVDESDRAAVETVREAGESVVTLSEKVGAIESMMTGPVRARPVSVPDLVDGVVTSTREDVAFDIETEVPLELALETDPEILSVVLGNVVENAAEHGANPRSTVSITVESWDEGCLFHVIDDGPGIPPAELEALETGSETVLEHGSGLGLWAIKWGVTRLGGAVRFDSIADGTRVTVWIPEFDDSLAGASTNGDATRDGSSGSAADDWIGSGTAPPATPWTEA